MADPAQTQTFDNLRLVLVEPDRALDERDLDARGVATGFR
jgi:hypothetical protein